MAEIFNRAIAPNHLFSIRELDFSADLFAERVNGPWFRLGARTVTPRRNEIGVEDVISRQSLLLAHEDFAEVFESLESVGNVIDNLGKPGGSVSDDGIEKKYSYAPFHRFEFRFASAVGEPLVFVHSGTSATQLLINPDLWLFFELEEKARGNGIWWDPRRGVDVLVERMIEQGNLQVVEIRVDYLLKYIEARQMSLLIGHYRHLHFFDPSQANVDSFVKEDVVLGSPDIGAKAILQNWGLRGDIPGTAPFLQRRLHLWFQIRPSAINTDDPWTDQPSFDPYAFTLPTRVGPVAPARWKRFRETDGRTFEGVVCDSMSLIYFRQEVLSKYEGAAGFTVKDDGSVSCHHYWSLVRSTVRIGNELLATAIGDFSEGVPFEEWPHWKQYAVDPPSPDTAETLAQEQGVSEAVNILVQALESLNGVFARIVDSLRVDVSGPLWCGSLDSLAGRQLKWVYPATADDDEFLKRATLTSTLVIEGIETASLRKLMNAIGSNLHMNDESPPRLLGSRNLLQRLTLAAVLIENFQIDTAGIPMLIRQAEGKDRNKDEPELQDELEKTNRQVRDELAPLAFLYDLRNYAGLAHAPNIDRAASAAKEIGLPGKNWHRTDYLRLLRVVTSSVWQINSHLESAELTMANLRVFENG